MVKRLPLNVFAARGFTCDSARAPKREYAGLLSNGDRTDVVADLS